MTTKSSKQYWFDREMENTRKNIKRDKNYAKYLESIYKNAAKNIEAEINRFYVKYAGDEGITMAEARKRVKGIDMKEYEAKAKEYVKNKDFTKRANEEMRLYNLGMKINRLELLKANINLELIKLGNETEKSMGEHLKDGAKEEFKRQAGILGKGVSNPDRKAEAIASASFHNADFSENIWTNLHILRNKLESLLEKSFIAGESPRKMIPKLKKIFGASTYEANRLAVTEMARVQIESQKLSFEKNGITAYQFLDTDGPRTCEYCKALDGKVFDVKKMVIGENAPPAHPNCRCSIAAYEDSEEYEAWLDHLANGGTTKSWQLFKKLKRKG